MYNHNHRHCVKEYNANVYSNQGKFCAQIFIATINN